MLLPSGGENMWTKACSLGLAPLLVMGIAACSKSESSQVDVDKNINLVQAALGQARSWHVSSNFAFAKEISHIEEDVGCPFNYHRVGRVIDGPRRLPDEILATQKGYYSREDDQWSAYHPAPNDYCKEGPSAGVYPLARSLEVMKTASTLREGELQTIDGTSCREFEFISTADPNLKLASLCIDDGLPSSRCLPTKLQTLVGGSSRWTRNIPVKNVPTATPWKRSRCRNACIVAIAA
jgi:hypothetical protein